MTALKPSKAAAKDHRANLAIPTQAAEPVERELKLRLRPQDLARLRARLDARAPSRTEAVDSIYLDTPDRRLARARAALRLRALGAGRRRWVQTLKTDDDGAAFSARGEWETAAPGGRLAPQLLADSPLERLLGTGEGVDGAAHLKHLAPIFRTRFTRTIWDIAVPGGHIEAVIDDGQVEAGAACEPILEAELELKGGQPEAVWQLAIALTGGGAGGPRLALLPYGDSKAARGYRLAAGVAIRPRSTRPSFEGDGLLEAAAVARMLIAQEMIGVLANAEGLRSGNDTEFVHQARICLRRMRACLDILDVRLPAPLDDGLRIWSERFGRVRDWDVLCQQQLPQLIDDLGSADPAAWERITVAAHRHRDAATQQLRQALESAAFAHLVLRLLQWSAISGAAGGKGADKPVGAQALKAIRKQMQRVGEAGRNFAEVSPRRQHRIRQQAKTVRYAIDCLAPVLPHRLQGAVRRALVRFQDAAGRVQDSSVAAAAVQRLTRSAALHRELAAWAAQRRAKPAQKAQRLAARLSA